MLYNTIGIRQNFGLTVITPAVICPFFLFSVSFSMLLTVRNPRQKKIRQKPLTETDHPHHHTRRNDAFSPQGLTNGVLRNVFAFQSLQRKLHARNTVELRTHGSRTKKRDCHRRFPAPQFFGERLGIPHHIRFCSIIRTHQRPRQKSGG